MDSPKITVIMPVYRTQATLPRAVQSIRDQSFKDWELLLVDDCSPDGSGVLAQELAGSDPRIRVFHKQKNEGLAMARNTGVAQARGDYICFVDSDDWVEPQMLGGAWEAAQRSGAQAVVYGYCQDFSRSGLDQETTAVVAPTPKQLDSRRRIAEYAAVLDKEKVFAYTTNKLYRRQTILDSGVTSQKIPLIEDLLFNAQLFAYLDCLVVLDSVYYHYMKYGAGSLTDAFVPEYSQLICRRFDAMKALYESAGVYGGDVRRELCNVHLRHVVSAFERECAAGKALSAAQKRRRMKELLHTPQTLEALQFARGTSKQARLLNAVVRTKSAVCGMAFGWLLHTVKKRRPDLFDKLK